MRKLLVLILCLFVAACETPPPKPEPAPPAPPPPPKPVLTPEQIQLSLLAERVAPDRDTIREQHRYSRAIKSTSVQGLRYYYYKPEGQKQPVGFSIRNLGSPKINPPGLRGTGALRQFTFLFPDRASENIHLSINDDVKLSGRFSRDNMFREMFFFPRQQLPSLQLSQDGRLIEITLPTGESSVIDRESLEIVSGVLEEQPIDFNKNRFARKSPGIKYTGNFLSISVDQRGESPRRAHVFGQDKLATVSYPSKYSKPCRISPKYLFDQTAKRGEREPRLHMLHPTDASLYQVLEQRCRWDLSDLQKS